nr:uncharacterized protein LOC105323950 isoform X6 [Crassostrea gigas]
MNMKMTQSRKMRTLTFTTVQLFFMLTDAELNWTTTEEAKTNFSDYISTNEAATSHFSDYESTDETDSHRLTTETATSHFSNYESTVDAIVGILFTILIVSMVVLFAWNFQNHRHRMQNSLSQQPKNCLATVDNIIQDNVITRSESDRKQNDDAYSITQIPVYENQKRISMETENIYVEKDEGQYDHLHSIRPKLTESQEEERYGTASDVDCFYSTAGQIRKASSVVDDEYNSVVLGIYDEHGCRSEEDTNYDNTYPRARNNWLY